MSIDVTALSGADLATLEQEVVAERRRRTTLALAEVRMGEVQAAVTTALGRADGDEWVQPQGAHDAYRLDATATRDGKLWRSLIDWNVWPPGDDTDPQSYRWWLDLTPVPDPPPGGVPAWVPGVAYVTGDRVTYNGKVYICRQAHTAQTDWTPAAVPALWLEE